MHQVGKKKTNGVQQCYLHTSKNMKKETILEKYMSHVLEHGSETVSVFQFCKKIKIDEADFYAEFNSFDAVRSWFWEHIFHTTVKMLKEDDTYNGYSASEKLSAFYFLWTQQLLSNRSFVLQHAHKTMKGILPTERYLMGFRKVFLSYADEIVRNGIESREVAERKFISDRFKDALWVQTIFLLNFWIKDSSKNFEATDAAIEKSVSLGFKLMGENMLDQVFDFGKFMFQNMREKMA